jgi:hypothetical protein
VKVKLFGTTALAVVIEEIVSKTKNAITFFIFLELLQPSTL